jgi:formylglycine-generating enzyme required for sulfatase activity
LKTEVLGESCLKVRVPILIGVSAINVKFSDDDSTYKINLAVGMKYLDFKNEEVLLGFNKKDPKRLVSITGSYLVDKYPVTNCEFTQLMWDSIPAQTSFKSMPLQEIHSGWLSRKRNDLTKEKCDIHDSAANTVFLYQAMEYANARSIRERLKPYYIFSESNEKEQGIISKGKYVIGYFDFTNHDKEFIQVTVDSTSDGYRLPYYDEWMMFARGGDKKNRAPWSNYPADEKLKHVLKYALFGTSKDFYDSSPVGQLLPNGYGLYDIFGLVWEHVLFEERNPFKILKNRPSCLKGGDNTVLLNKDYNNIFHATIPEWKDIDYGYYKQNYNGGAQAGFRLIRNIGNNAKWSEVKSDNE